MASRSSETADSYIGSLISLTTKFEIRYEGTLRTIDTKESSIGLINVKSYGTEGRKKDGQEVPPNDRVFEYILFRGSNIKDLTVKAAAPVQNSLPIHNDPAIIQSQHYLPLPVSTSLPSAGSEHVADISSHAAQVAFPRSTFQGDLPLYQPGDTLGSWVSRPSPNTDNCGLTTNPSPSTAQTAVPREILQGGLPLYQPGGNLVPWGSSPFPDADGSGLAVSSSQAQMAVPVSTFQGGFPLYQPGGSLGSWGSSARLSTDSSSLAMPMYWQGFYGPSNALPHAQQPSLLQPPFSLPMQYPMHYPMTQPMYPTASAPGTSNLPASSVPAQNLPASSTTAPMLLSLNSREPAPPLLPPLSIGSVNLNRATPQSTLHPQASAVALSLLSNSPSTAAPSSAPASASLPLVSQLSGSGLDTNGSTSSDSMPKTAPLLPLPYPNMSHSVNLETSKPALLTPRQLLQSHPARLSSSVSSSSAKKDVKVFRAALSKPPPSVLVTTQEPILPLPSSPNQKISSSMTRFTEEFDFTAMNEKFKKDEIWGDIGKAYKTKNKGYNRKEDAGDVFDDNVTAPIQQEKSAYSKDEFFDSLSCRSFNYEQQNDRTRTKTNTETFGDFPRHRGGHGGQWPGRGGRSGGSYYGRGYGYRGRGQG